MADVLLKNLARMTSQQRGGMHYALIMESMGRTAVEGHSHMAANFHFNPETGEIKYFGNIQDVPQDVRRVCSDSMFRLITDVHQGGSGKYRILGYTPPQTVSQQAREVLSRTVHAYNAQHGF